MNASGATVYNVSSYNSNVVGIARDDNSNLLQKQSHQPDDSTRIYLSNLQTTNAANGGSFSSNAQFVMIGNDNGSSAFSASSEYPSGLQILSRIGREWKITNTDFTGTFSIDITPAAGSYDVNTLRLLVDDDGNFSNGGTSIYASVFGYSGGVISVNNITTSISPTNSTRYITLATVASPGAISPNLTLWLKTDAGITQSGGSVSQWNDQSSSGFHVSQATASRRPLLSADTLNYYAVPAFDGVDDTLANTNMPYSGIMNVTGGISDATTGSLFTVARVKSLSTDSRIIYQWNTAPTGSFVLQSFVDNTTGELKVGGRGALNGINTLPDLKPFIATALETSGANNALHYYNGGSQKNGTTVSNNAYTGTNFLRVGAKLNGYVAEAIAYNVKLTDLQRRQIESYLAIKYGITMSNIGGGTFGDYISTAGTTLWDASDNSGYHNQVIGIGRDDSTALLQKQSHTGDDTTRMYLSTLQTTNAANGGSFGSNFSYVVTGNNGGQMFSTGSTEYPTGQNIYARLDREWKITNTNFTGTFSMDFKPKFTGVTASDLRIMVDADGDFSNATVVSPTINYSTGVITVSGIDNTMIPANSTRYITIVSLSATTSLPVSLTAFTAQPKGMAVQLNWTTATEQNNAYFAIERSANNAQWQQVGKVAGAGNSNQTLNYTYVDQHPLNGTSYYRLKQTDADGTSHYSSTVTVHLQNENTSLRVYPNPVNNRVMIKGSNIDRRTLKVFDMLGKDITQLLEISSTGSETIVNLAVMPEGLYFIRIKEKTYKVMKK